MSPLHTETKRLLMLMGYRELDAHWLAKGPSMIPASASPGAKEDASTARAQALSDLSKATPSRIPRR